MQSALDKIKIMVDEVESSSTSDSSSNLENIPLHEMEVRYSSMRDELEAMKKEIEDLKKQHSNK